jgi:hypothetical protein
MIRGLALLIVSPVKKAHTRPITSTRLLWPCVESRKRADILDKHEHGALYVAPKTDFTRKADCYNHLVFDRHNQIPQQRTHLMFGGG